MGVGDALGLSSLSHINGHANGSNNNNNSSFKGSFRKGIESKGALYGSMHQIEEYSNNLNDSPIPHRNSRGSSQRKKAPFKMENGMSASIIGGSGSNQRDIEDSVDELLNLWNHKITYLASK